MEIENIECPICLNTLDKNDKSIITVKCCNQQFHINCYVTWMNQKRICPLCRTDYNTPEQNYNSGNNNNQTNGMMPDTIIRMRLLENENVIMERNKIGVRITIVCISIATFIGMSYIFGYNSVLHNT